MLAGGLLIVMYFYVMKDMKKTVAAQLEDLSDVILTLTGCKCLWGEPELPDCMRVEMESESEN